MDLTQWAGLGLVLALTASWWLDRANPSDAWNPLRTANVAFRSAMLVAVGIASWVAVRIFGASVEAMGRTRNERIIEKPRRDCSQGRE